MLNISAILPSDLWGDGQVLSWESDPAGLRLYYEVIPDPMHFNASGDSVGDLEIIELFDPSDGHTMTIKSLDEGGAVSEEPPIILTRETPRVCLLRGSRIIMDTTLSTESNLTYTRLIIGKKTLAAVSEA